jgi:hypothetical protein
LDCDKSTLQVERGIVEQNVDDVKTDDSRRTFNVAPELLGVLKAWNQASDFAEDGDWMFASPLKIGRLPYSYTGVWRELKRAAAASNVGDSRYACFPAHVSDLAGFHRYARWGAAEAHASR